MSPKDSLQKLKETRDLLLKQKEQAINDLRTTYPDVVKVLENIGVDINNLSKYSKNISMALLLASSLSLSPITDSKKEQVLSILPESMTTKALTYEDLKGLNEDQKLRKVWENYGDIIKNTSAKYGLDSKVILATIMIESSGNAFAKRSEPQINDASYGLGQILYGTAKGIGFKGSQYDLYDPKTNIDLIGKYQRRILDAYGNDLNNYQIITAYNAGSPWANPLPGHLYKFERWMNKINNSAII